jgi:hypothetical protein
MIKPHVILAYLQKSSPRRLHSDYRYFGHLKQHVKEQTNQRLVYRMLQALDEVEASTTTNNAKA